MRVESQTLFFFLFLWLRTDPLLILRFLPSSSLSLSLFCETLRKQSTNFALEAAASDVVEAVEAPEVSDREAVAYLRNLRGSPNKVRRVLDAIRGMSYEDALMALEFMPYRACDDILKVLYSVRHPSFFFPCFSLLVEGFVLASKD